MNYEYKVQIKTNDKEDWITTTPWFKNIIDARVFAKRYKSMCRNLAGTRIVRRPTDWEVVE